MTRGRAPLAVFLALVATASLAASPQADLPAAAARQAATVPSSPIGDSPRVLLIPEKETTLVAQMVGRVLGLGGGLGDPFRAGTALVRFDCSEAQARLRMADAELHSAQENLGAKKRLKDLNAAGDVEVSLAAAAVDKARAQIDLSRVQLRLCAVSAPFAGRIVKLHVREFQGVNVGQPLMDIVASGPLKLRLNVPSRWLRWLKPGAPFDVAIDETGKQYPAKVTAINARVDAVSQSVEIEGRIGGTFPELLAGMSGTARFAQAR